MITLRPYQHEALAAIGAAASRGLRRLLLTLPTGPGKTVICVVIARAVAHLVAPLCDCPQPVAGLPPVMTVTESQP